MEDTKLPLLYLAWTPLPSHYNGPYGGPQTDLTITLHGGLYLAIIMDRYEGPITALTIALYGSLYLAFIMDHYGGAQIALTIAFQRGLNLAIIMDR
jgi:hypothetical protein